MTDRERVDAALRETGFWRPGLAEAFVGLLRSVREECAQVAERHYWDVAHKPIADAIRESGE